MKKFLPTWGLLAVAAICAAALAFVYWGDIPFKPHNKASELGQMGDFFGGLLNPIVSALTLFVAINVWRLQKDELELTRNELAQTKLVIKEQAETAEQQRREQRFFDLLNLYRSTVDSLEFEITSKSGDGISLRGKRALRHLTSRHGQNPLILINEVLDQNTVWPESLEPRLVEFWESESHVLDHYFRIIFTLLSEAEPILNVGCYRYMKLLRAQLSRDEVNLLAFNLLFDDEGKKMRNLAAKYGILRHMPASALRAKGETDLDGFSFGQKWAQQNTSNSS